MLNKQIYIYRIGAIGDSAATIPAIEFIKSTNPGVPITILTALNSKNTFWDELRAAGYISRVLTYQLSSISTWLALALTIRRDIGEKQLYYMAPYRSATQRYRDLLYFSLVCGIKKIWGIRIPTPPIAGRGVGNNLLRAISEYERLFLIAASSLAQPGDNKYSYSTISLELELPPIAEAIAEWNKSGANIVAIAFGSKMPSKRWPLDRYAELFSAVSTASPSARYILFGDNTDYGSGEAFAARFPGAVLNLCGKTTILQSIAVLKRCTLYVGNDSGAMHLAALAGIPIVAIFSSRDNPGKWEPPGALNTYIRKELPCSGCMLTECPTMECLKAITVPEVLERVLRLLNSK